MLAETMAEVKAGRMDPKVANTLACVGTVTLRAYEADAAHSAAAPLSPEAGTTESATTLRVRVRVPEIGLIA